MKIRAEAVTQDELVEMMRDAHRHEQQPLPDPRAQVNELRMRLAALEATRGDPQHRRLTRPHCLVREHPLFPTMVDRAELVMVVIRDLDRSDPFDVAAVRWHMEHCTAVVGGYDVVVGYVEEGVMHTRPHSRAQLIPYVAEDC